MRTETGKKKEVIDKQEIINYEYQILEQSIPQAKPVITNTHKYSEWDLNTKIKKVVEEQAYTTRWIGNSTTAYLQAYAYILLIGSGYSEASVLEFKHTIYKLGSKCLDLAQQKLLVQFLCLIEYSSNRYSFLNKYPQIQIIFIKILQSLEGEKTNSEPQSPCQKNKAKVKRKKGGKFTQMQANEQCNFSSQQLQVELQLQEVYKAFNVHFKFIDIVGSNEYCCSLKLFNEKVIYIVIEKDCYFMIEPINRKQIHQMTLSVKKGVLNDFDKIMNNQEEIVDETSIILTSQPPKQRKQNYQVQQSNVIPVQRASQIRKPNQQQKFKPRPVKFATLAIKVPKQFEKLRSEDKIQHDRTFIDELHDQESKIDPDSPVRSLLRKASKKDKMVQKMKEIKAMKQALQQVRNKIQMKIKTLDEMQTFKTEVVLKYIQRNSLEKAEGPNIKETPKPLDKNQLIKYHSTNELSKKDRKISYNETTAYQKKKMEQKPIFDRNSYKIQPVFKNPASYSPINSRPLSKIGSANGQISLTKNPFDLNSNMKQIPQTQIINSISPNNVNVNVNLSINENFIHPYFSPQSKSFKLDKETFDKFPTHKQGSFPNRPNITAPVSRGFQNTNINQQANRFPIKINNPQKATIIAANF